MFFFLSTSFALKDSDPLITQELVDAINNNPKSTFKATLYPKFAKMTIGDAKRFLSPIRPVPNNHGSAVPVGANENFMHNVDNQYITGLTNVGVYPSGHGSAHNHNPLPTSTTMKFPIFDVTELCSSWAPAVTSAMTISVSRWANQFVNFSLQYVLDCDILGDACIERTPLNAYQLFWSYHPPDYNGWDKPGFDNSERSKPTDAPRSDFTREHCSNEKCYPGTTNCAHHWALTGSCNPGDAETACPIYFLYNWRWIKSHLWEVGAVTSSIVVHSDFFSYSSLVYSSQPVTGSMSDPIGMLDVTIIGWGQSRVNLSTDETAYNVTKNRWWWVIPHLGSFGVGLETGIGSIGSENYIWTEAINAVGAINAPITSTTKGFVKFNRRFDDCNIESHAVGAVPYNFVPLPYRTPEPTE